VTADLCQLPVRLIHGVALALDRSVPYVDPVWILLATSPDWRWLLGREDSPWYPTVRLFRQTVPRQWSHVFRRVAAAVKEGEGSAPQTDQCLAAPGLRGGHAS
jgi:hypothetical protein